MNKTLPRLGAPLLTILFSIMMMLYVSAQAGPDPGEGALNAYRTAMLLSASMAAAAFLLDIFRGIRVQSMLLALSILFLILSSVRFGTNLYNYGYGYPYY